MSDHRPLDILLVHPVFLRLSRAEDELMSPYFPLGLLYLAAFLRERGLSVEIFDATFQDGPEDFAAVLAQRQPKVVGIGVVRPNRETALQLAKFADAAGATVIMGGPDPTRSPDVYLEQPYVDFVVHHEGEITTAELLETLKRKPHVPNWLYDMPGIAFREATGKLVINPRRPYLLDLDNLPMPARDLVDMEQYLELWRKQNGYSSLTISVSRGCPYGCHWCQDSVLGPELRQRSPENVVAEVKALMARYQIDRLRLVDDVDGLDRAWLEAWAACAEDEDVVVPFEALDDLKRKDVPMLDVRDSL